MGGGGGGKQTSTAEPWKGQQPYLRDLFKQAQGIYRGGYGQEFYPGQLVAPFSPYTQAGIQNLGMFGSQMSPSQAAAVDYTLRDPSAISGRGMDYVGGAPVIPGSGFGESTLPGGASPTPYFSGNPHLDAMVQQSIARAGEGIQEQVMPGIAATFGGAGRTGGGIQQQMMENVGRDFGRTAGEMAQDIYGQAYETGMQRDLQRRQMEMDMMRQQAGMAPQLQAMQQNQLNAMLQAGAITEDQAQRYIDAERQRFDFYQQAPWQALQQYGNIIQGMPGGYGTTPQAGPERSRLAGAAGGAMAGSAFGPWGMAVGGGLGALGVI